MGYLNWHYLLVWRKLFILWRNVSLFPLYYFSVPLHFSTLFAPWKRQRVHPKPGFHPYDLFAVVTFNLLSRILGAIMRLSLITYGICFSLILFVLLAVPVYLWVFLPVFSLPIYFLAILNSKLDSFEKRKKIFVTLHLSSQQDMDPSAVRQTERWFELLESVREKPLVWDLNKIKNMPGLGVLWPYGYTVELDKYSEDLSKTTTRFPLLVGREKELEIIQRTLLKAQENNVLIVGEPGVARHIIVETLAHRIFMGQCQPALSHKRILKLDMERIVSVKPTILETKAFFADLLAEASHGGNIILVVDNLDKYVSTGEGRVDLSDVFAKIAQSNVAFIGITTPENFHKYVENNKALHTFFEKIEIEPPNEETTLLELMLSIAPVLEKRYKIIITYEALKKTLEDARQYISTTPYPAKAIELLDESALYLRARTEEKVLLPTHVDAVISEKYHIQLGEIQKGEKEKLVNLEDILHQNVINQNQAIRVISSALRRRRLAVSATNRPIGTFLFLGPTGVGKTETAKTLARVYFGSSEKMLRFDMGQYQKVEGIERLIGSAILKTPGELTSSLSDNPFSVVLFDEFEKADREVFNLFLPLLDEGYITNCMGEKIDAKNTIIIATSNAGALFIRESLEKGISVADLEKDLIDYVQKEKIFTPELLNRFDAVVVFTPLTEGNLREIARMQLLQLNNRLKNKEISVAITDDLVRKLSLLGFDPVFGARTIKRVIAEKIEDQIAQKLLVGAVRKGEEIAIDL